MANYRRVSEVLVSAIAAFPSKTIFTRKFHALRKCKSLTNKAISGLYCLYCHFYGANKVRGTTSFTLSKNPQWILAPAELSPWDDTKPRDNFWRWRFIENFRSWNGARIGFSNGAKNCCTSSRILSKIFGRMILHSSKVLRNVPCVLRNNWT